jgi:hypothetical protein
LVADLAARALGTIRLASQHSQLRLDDKKDAIQNLKRGQRRTRKPDFVYAWMEVASRLK